MQNLLQPANLLLTTIFLPLAGAAWIWTIADKGKIPVRQSALVTTLITFVLAVLLIKDYHGGTAFYGAASLPWLGKESGIDVRLAFGLDGLSIWLFGLTTLLMLPSVLVSWEAIEERPGAFYALLLLLESGMLGVFAARDLILFYICFEFTLIPLFFLIGVWGSEQRRYAAIKFFLFTLAGSVITFLGLLAIVLWNYSQTAAMTFSIPQLTASLAKHPLPLGYQVLIFVALFAGFAIKVPLFPLHTWLPLAHVQAPTAGSVILAGVLLKIGTYGFLRFSVPMLPEATAVCAPWLLWLSVICIIYGALVALAQSDIKRLIAYSSVSHLGFCMLGLFALNSISLQGSVLQMVNHGLSTGGLFALVGMVYERYHTREIRDLGGLARRTPWLAFFLVLFTFSSIGLPGLNGFVGEFLILLGMFQRANSLDLSSGLALQYQVIAVLAVFGVVLGAWYMLWLVQRTIFGPLREPAGADHGHADHSRPDHSYPVADMSGREILALAPLVVFIFWIGLAPNFFLEQMGPSLDRTTAAAARAFDAREATAVIGELPRDE